MKTKIGFGIAGKCDDEDFLITPAIAFTKARGKKGYGWAIGARWGFWGVYMHLSRFYA